MNRTLLIALTFFVGAIAGVGAALITWQPYTDQNLTRAVIRDCGTRAMPRGNDRCWLRLNTAFETWEDNYYEGDNAPRLWRP